METLNGQEPAEQGCTLKPSENFADHHVNSINCDEPFAEVEHRPHAPLPLRRALAAFGVTAISDGAGDIAAQCVDFQEKTASQLNGIAADVAECRQALQRQVELMQALTWLEERVNKLEALRTDFINPLCLRIMGMIDEIDASLALLNHPGDAVATPAGSTPNDVVKTVMQAHESRLSADRVVFINLLREYGVQEFRTRQGDRFDPKRHENAGVVPASHPDEHGLIHGVVHPGYWRDDVKHVVRRADVRVRVWKAPNS